MLGLVLLVFAAKAWFWNLPYHWDESGAYMPPVHWLAMQPLWRVLPGFHEVGLFYGHPPLLFVLLAGLFKLFGESISLAHAVMTGFSALGIVYIYLLGKYLWNRPAGLIAACLTFFMPTWFAESAMVLGDLPIAAVGVMVIYYTLRGRLGLYLACGICLVMLKETAGAIILGILLYKMIFTPRRNWKVGLWGIPLVPLIAFLLWQKLATGFFCPNPYFISHPMLEFSPARIAGQAAWMLLWTFIWHSRWLLLVIILLQGLRYPRALFRREHALFAIIILIFAVTFSTLYWMNRYMLAVFPLLCLLAGGALVRILRPTVSRVLLTLLILLAFTIHYTGKSTGYYNYDDCLEYLDMIAVNHQAATYLADHHPQKRIWAVWPLCLALKEPWQGYLRQPLRVVEKDEPFDLLVYYDLPDCGTLLMQPFIKTGEVRLAQRFTQNGKWVEIYVKN